MAIGLNHRSELALNDFGGASCITFGQRFAHADDGRDTLRQSLLGFGSDQRIGLAVVLTSLRMADDGITAAKIFEHDGAHFTRESTRRLAGDILRAQGHTSQSRQLTHQGNKLRQVRRRNAKRHITGRLGRHAGSQPGQQGLVGSQTGVHFPVCSDQCGHACFSPDQVKIIFPMC